MVLKIIKTYNHPLSWIYTLLLLVGLGMQLNQPVQLVDTPEYQQSIHYFLHPDTLKIDPFGGGRWMFPVRRTLLYPLFLYMFNIRGIAILQTLLAWLIPAILCVCFDIQTHKIKRNFFWVWWISAPLQYFYASLPMPEIVAQFGLVFWLIFQYKKSNFALSVVTALLILLKPIFIVLFIPLFLQVFMVIKRERTFYPILFACIPIFVVFVQVNFNKTHWNFAGISSVGTTNAYEYNRYMLLKEQVGQTQTDSIYTKESAYLNTLSNLDLQKGDWMSEKVWNSISENPFTYAYLHLKGSIQMFVDPGRYDAMVFFRWKPHAGFMQVKEGSGTHNKTRRPLKEWFYILFFALLNSIKLLILFRVLFIQIVRYKQVKIWQVLSWLIIGLYALAIGPVGTARYAIVLYPLIAVLVVNEFPLRKKNALSNIIARFFIKRLPVYKYTRRELNSHEK